MMRKILMVGAVLVLALAVAASAYAQQPASGAATYNKMCASCHGAHGTPNAGMAKAMGIPDFAAASFASVADSTLQDAIVNGKGRTMPSYKSRLTAAQVKEVVAYLRTLSAHH
jgi:cytochrome c6